MLIELSLTKSARERERPSRHRCQSNRSCKWSNWRFSVVDIQFLKLKFDKPAREPREETETSIERAHCMCPVTDAAAFQLERNK